MGDGLGWSSVLCVVVSVATACAPPADIAQKPTAPPIDTTTIAPVELGDSLPNWQLAQALPADGDFPSEWDYSLHGSIDTTQPVVATSIPPEPDALYTPAQCAEQPRIFDLYRKVGMAAATVEVNLHGQDYQLGHKAQFRIWHVADGPALIEEYSAWLTTCGDLRVTRPNAADDPYQQSATAPVAVVVDRDPVAGADAAIAVTRSRYEAFYAVRGVLLGVTTNMEGPDAAVIRQLGPQTVSEIGSLTQQFDLAPGLAALSGDQLMALLPGEGDIPSSWFVKASEPSNRFGYSSLDRTYSQYVAPPACVEQMHGLQSPPAWAAQLVMTNPALPPDLSRLPDYTLYIARDFTADFLASVKARVSACAEFTIDTGSGRTTHYSTKVLEDSRFGDLQIFRYVSTRTDPDDPIAQVRSVYYVYVRMAHLVIGGEATAREPDQDSLNRLVSGIVGRMPLS